MEDIERAQQLLVAREEVEEELRGEVERLTGEVARLSAEEALQSSRLAGGRDKKTGHPGGEERGNRWAELVGVVVCFFVCVYVSAHVCRPSGCIRV